MDDHSASIAIQSSLRASGHQNTGNTVPSQVLFMDSHDMPSRTNALPPSSGFYQVATPKSPHELTLDGDEDVIHNDGSGNHSSGSIVQGDDHHGTHVIGMGKSTRESEEMERLKYETAKNEILDKLHLHTLISHKELQGIQVEIGRVNAQMRALEKLHDDKELLEKIEEYHERENERKKFQLSEMNALANSSSGYFADATLISFPSGTPSNAPLSASSATPMHHYHTRSKSQGNVAEVPHLRPANAAIIDLRMAGSKSIPEGNMNSANVEPGYEILPFRPNQMNLHHRRNYSSTSLTSNSGVVGRTENDEAIFRRYDGILIVITCSNCQRSGFTSAQGIVNHARLKHSKTYSSQPLAVLNNQRILEDEKQDPKVLEKFKEFGKDPKSDYLPCEIAIPSSSKRSSQREASPKNTIPKNSEGSAGINAPRNVSHLEKIYGKNDFKELVNMVQDAQKDLDVVLNLAESENDSSAAEEENKEVKEQSDESEYAVVYSNSEREGSALSSSSSAKPETHDLNSNKKNNQSSSSQAGAQRRNQRKRRSEASEQEKELKERLRPAEKKARPDVLALSNIPDHEKRSSHYNLRAKSKLRGINTKYD